MLAPCHDLVAFADGELKPARADAFRDHLPGCPSCRQALVDANQLRAQLSTFAAPVPVIGWWGRLLRWLSSDLRRTSDRAQLATHYELEANNLRDAIRAWAAAREAWDACPAHDVTRFARTHRAFAEAEQKMIEALESTGGEPSPGWQERVLAQLPNDNNKTKEEL